MVLSICQLDWNNEKTPFLYSFLSLKSFRMNKNWHFLYLQCFYTFKIYTFQNRSLHRWSYWSEELDIEERNFNLDSLEPKESILKWVQPIISKIHRHRKEFHDHESDLSAL